MELDDKDVPYLRVYLTRDVDFISCLFTSARTLCNRNQILIVASESQSNYLVEVEDSLD